jgi:hypothetical protein
MGSRRERPLFRTEASRISWTGKRVTFMNGVPGGGAPTRRPAILVGRSQDSSRQYGTDDHREQIDGVGPNSHFGCRNRRIALGEVWADG